MNTRIGTVVAVCLSLVCCLAGATDGPEKANLSTQLERAKHRATQHSYALRYQFRSGETLRWKVVHLTTVETTVRGTTQTAKSRAISTKVWTAKDVDDDGNMTFVHSVSDIKMWQQVADRAEIRYDSENDDTPPVEYIQAAKKVGVPLATVTISPIGNVLDRSDSKRSTNMGLGSIVIPFPEESIEVGHQWYAPNEIRVRLPDRRVQRVKTRVEFTLDSVSAGLATIAMKTQVLTPINDPKVKSQLIQYLTDGTVKFDIDTGHVVSRQTDWDETVIGFEGPESLMKYLARFTEELLPVNSTAQVPSGETRS